LPQRKQTVHSEQVVWVYPDKIPTRGDVKPLQSAPAVDAQGRVYVHAQGRLVALQEENGVPNMLWEYVTGSYAPGPPVLAPDGSLRLHCSDGTVHCISSTGRQMFNPVVVDEPLGHAAPIIDAQGNTYICHFDGGLVKIDPEGRLQSGSYFRTRQKFDAGGIIFGDLLYIGSQDGYMFAIRMEERRGKNTWDHAREQGYTGWYIHCTPVIDSEGLLIVAGREENLYGFAEGGKEAWKAHIPGQMLASPVLDEDNHIYVALTRAERGVDARGSLVCVDGNSHKIRWEYEAKGPTESTPVIGDDGIIYFGDNEGYVHAVDMAGNGQWTAEVGDSVRSAGTIIAPGRLAFGIDNENLIVLECSSQSIAQTGWPKIAGTLAQNGIWNG